MLSLRDKLRSSQGSPKRQAALKPAPQNCYITGTRFPLDKIFLPDGILPLMQGDEKLPQSIRPEELLFLDTETTGLSGGAGTLAFLVGVGTIEAHELIVRQYLMRDYDEEVFVLQHTQQHLRACRTLITYNGRSFDMPLLSSRFIMQRMPMDVSALPHADLLHTARRVWKLRLQRCTLAALEEHIFHEPRQDDLPGAEVPQRYFQYLKTHNLALLDDILRHNAQDIATLARLLFLLAELHTAPMLAEHIQDIYSLGRIYDKRGKLEEARACYRAADAGSMSTLSRAHLADSFRRSKRPEAAAAIYEKMIAARQGGAAPYIALCKLLEHKLHNPAKAADIARKGLLLLADRPMDSRAQNDFDDLSHRYARLLAKSGQG